MEILDRDFERDIAKKLYAMNRELQEVNTQIEKLEKSRAVLFARMKPLVDYLNALNAERRERKIKILAEKVPFNHLSRTKAAREILRQKKNLTTSELYNLMKNRGYPFRSKRPVSDLATALNTSRHFEKDENGKWYLIDPKKNW